jgi:uncharacterized protein YodC (DUF2158 family)
MRHPCVLLGVLKENQVSNIKIGDKVSLKSGSPMMTVTSVHQDNGSTVRENKVTVKYWNQIKSEISTEVITSEALEKEGES